MNAGLMGPPPNRMYVLTPADMAESDIAFVRAQYVFGDKAGRVGFIRPTPMTCYGQGRRMPS
jgi:hypothetical protein